MKRTIIQSRNFTKEIENLLKKRLLLQKDWNNFRKQLIENPNMGDIIPGTGGIRKIRLKASSKGKSGGFRICYYDLGEQEKLYLLLIYSKNEQENLTMEEKKILKGFVKMLKGAKNG